MKAIPVTAEEEEAASGDRAAIDRLLARLDDQLTPSGQTPGELRRKAEVGGVHKRGTNICQGG